MKKGKGKFTVDPEEEKRFDNLKRKYANAVAFLLVKNVGQSQLRSYLENEENQAKYQALKSMRQSIIDARKGAK